jgi:hypothetical protein
MTPRRARLLMKPCELRHLVEQALGASPVMRGVGTEEGLSAGGAEAEDDLGAAPKASRRLPAPELEPEPRGVSAPSEAMGSAFSSSCRPKSRRGGRRGSLRGCQSDNGACPGVIRRGMDSGPSRCTHLQGGLLGALLELGGGRLRDQGERLLDRQTEVGPNQLQETGTLRIADSPPGSTGKGLSPSCTRSLGARGREHPACSSAGRHSWPSWGSSPAPPATPPSRLARTLRRAASRRGRRAW